ncbi:MAG: YkgJ family cysteine cluster protein [Desulfobulbaceae bacterium]|nr:YkgJ family cysteine cluster protein [Desulfobulbaceae bacterium]
MSEPELQLPAHIHPLADKESFTFACHPGVPCFTECCRDLELALSPYDVLRLRLELGISSQEFLDRYSIIERDGDAFPRVYLGMVDDGQANCPFVTSKGCRVYGGRPAPCRTYPLGRGAWQDSSGCPHAFYVLQREAHCLGFAEPVEQGVDQWIAGQGLADYYQANDMLLPLLHHEKLKQGLKPTSEQQDLYLATLYNLENFRNNNRNLHELTDLELMRCVVDWLIQHFFGEGV